MSEVSEISGLRSEMSQNLDFSESNDIANGSETIEMNDCEPK